MSIQNVSLKKVAAGVVAEKKHIHENVTQFK